MGSQSQSLLQLGRHSYQELSGLLEKLLFTGKYKENQIIKQNPPALSRFISWKIQVGLCARESLFPETSGQLGPDLADDGARYLGSCTGCRWVEEPCVSGFWPGDDCFLFSLEPSIGLQKALGPPAVIMALRDFHQKGDSSWHGVICPETGIYLYHWKLAFRLAGGGTGMYPKWRVIRDLYRKMGWLTPLATLSPSLCGLFHSFHILGWPKCLFWFFCNIVWLNLNQLFGQPNRITDIVPSSAASHWESPFCWDSGNFLIHLCSGSREIICKLK